MRAHPAMGGGFEETPSPLAQVLIPCSAEDDMVTTNNTFWFPKCDSKITTCLGQSGVGSLITSNAFKSEKGRKRGNNDNCSIVSVPDQDVIQ
jgi:hypothetical protein